MNVRDTRARAFLGDNYIRCLFFFLILKAFLSIKVTTAKLSLRDSVRKQMKQMSKHLAGILTPLPFYNGAQRDAF